MLAKIECDRFRQKVVEFSDGLNVIVGDDNATNSIGKSTLLMIIDFAFGGTTLIEHNRDVVSELGDHYYRIQFRDAEEDYFFQRGTLSSEIVEICDSAFKPSSAIKVEEYTAFLKSKFGPTANQITFRTAVGLFSRVWGKANLDVGEPLHITPKMKAATAVENLIKLYDRFDAIEDFVVDLKNVRGEQKALRDAFKHDLVPGINKTRYKKNLDSIDDSQLELDQIKQELSKFACNISEIADREIMELKELKDDLLRTRLIIAEKLNRVERNLKSKSYIKSRSMEPLKHFFPDVDESRLMEIEEFHSEISKILKSELRESRKELTDELAAIDSQLGEIDSKIVKAFASIDNPDAIVDRVYNVSQRLKQATVENDFYDQKKDMDSKSKLLSGELKKRVTTELSALEGTINTRIQEVVSEVYDEHRKSPVLTLSESNYQFEVFEDTGTGKAYSNLLILDLSIFDTCSLPFLIHDTPLFKNIENDTVGRLLKQYVDMGKQSFVALDEIEKYGEEAARLIMNRCVIKLSDNSVLFDKDWRDTGS